MEFNIRNTHRKFCCRYNAVFNVHDISSFIKCLLKIGNMDVSTKGNVVFHLSFHNINLSTVCQVSTFRHFWVGILLGSNISAVSSLECCNGVLIATLHHSIIGMAIITRSPDTQSVLMIARQAISETKQNILLG